jgi:hypothetical protein
MNASREELLFALALEKQAEKRPAFLDAMCQGDPALRHCRDQTAVHPLGQSDSKRCLSPLRSYRMDWT